MGFCWEFGVNVVTDVCCVFFGGALALKKWKESFGFLQKPLELKYLIISTVSICQYVEAF